MKKPSHTFYASLARISDSDELDQLSHAQNSKELWQRIAKSSCRYTCYIENGIRHG
jgi:hypothetical protein